MYFSISGVEFDFSSTQKSSALNGCFTACGLRGMLAERDYLNIHVVFYFLAAFMDRVLQISWSSCYTKIHTFYSDTVNQLIHDSWDGGRAEYSTGNLKGRPFHAEDVFGNPVWLPGSWKLVHSQVPFALSLSWKRFNVWRFVTFRRIFLWAFQCYHWEVYENKFNAKICTMIEAVIAMNAVLSLTEKLFGNSSEKREWLMSRKWTKLTLDRVVNTTFTLIGHVKSYGRAALKMCITATIKEALPACRAAPLPAQIILTDLKFKLIRGGSNVTSKHCDKET